MDRIADPSVHAKPPTSSTDPRQQAHPEAPPTFGSTKDITARDTVPTATDGIEGSLPGRTDGPKNPDPSSTPGAASAGTGTEYNTHMKGTAAPGSHSELFGLSPDEGKVHPPNSDSNSTSSSSAVPGSGLGSGVVGTSGHKGVHNSTTAGTGSGIGETGKPSLMDRLNPMKDADGDGKRGFSD